MVKTASASQTNIFKAYVDCLKKYCIFRGRASRYEYWSFTFVYILILWAFNFIPGGELVVLIYVLGTLLPSIAVAVRRFHDRGKSGWLYAALFASILSPLFITMAILGLLYFSSGSSADLTGTGSVLVLIAYILTIILAIGAMIYSFIIVCGRGQPEANKYGQAPETSPKQEKTAFIIIVAYFIYLILLLVVLSIAGVAGYSSATNKYKITKTLDQMQVASMNIRALYSKKQSYEGLNMKTLHDLRALDNDICPDSCVGNYGANQFGGKIFIAPVQQGKAFTISYDGIPTLACQAIVAANWGTEASGFMGIYVNGERRDPESPATGLCFCDDGCRVDLEFK
ncbi:MAG: DUF805 domain-containing protein [Alphaproteobacteria bacterium]|nr:DUF805 domain-containing protein [Alphaproteobacteria bacterium]